MGKGAASHRGIRVAGVSFTHLLEGAVLILPVRSHNGPRRLEAKSMTWCMKNTDFKQSKQ